MEPPISASLPEKAKVVSMLALVLTMSILTAGLTPLAKASSAPSSALNGGELWSSTSIPFQTYAGVSSILALPTLSAWLSSHSIAVTELRPYLSVWPSQGNPYDYAQGTVGYANNGTEYGVYSYILPNDTVIGAWVSENTPRTVKNIYTYPSESNSFSFTTTDNNLIAAGHQSDYSSDNGAEMNTTVFNDLTNPSSCGTKCWAWGEWLGTSNYDWTSSPGSNPFFFQSVLSYWGGNLGKPSNCGSNSYTTNCIFFQYALDTTTLSTYSPGVGDWTAGDSVMMQWPAPAANCNPAGGVSGNDNWVVVLKVTDLHTSQYTTYSECFPTNPYVQFLEERPTLSGGTIPQEPQFGTHSFRGYLLNPSGFFEYLTYGSNDWTLNMYNSGLGTELVSSSKLVCVPHGLGCIPARISTWSDKWLSSVYP